MQNLIFLSKKAFLESVRISKVNSLIDKTSFSLLMTRLSLVLMIKEKFKIKISRLFNKNHFLEFEIIIETTIFFFSRLCYTDFSQSFLRGRSNYSFWNLRVSAILNKVGIEFLSHSECMLKKSDCSYSMILKLTYESMPWTYFNYTSCVTIWQICSSRSNIKNISLIYFKGRIFGG